MCLVHSMYEDNRITADLNNLFESCFKVVAEFVVFSCQKEQEPTMVGLLFHSGLRDPLSGHDR